MKLDDLIKDIEEQEVLGERAIEVDGVAYNSKEVGKNFLFIAIKGTQNDGHSFIHEAILKGARAVVVEDKPENIKDITVVVTPDSRLALAQIAAKFYSFPTSLLTVIGITGTNGKTTTSYLIESIFKEAGFKVGVLGTINYRYGNEVIPAPMTTPESLDIQRMLSKMLNAGVTHVVMEISSHALDLKRVETLQFDVGVFTNLTQDHLDYHKTMEHYLNSKARLFKELLPEKNSKKASCAVLNADDPFVSKMTNDTTPNTICYGIRNKAQVFPKDTKLTFNGISTQVHTPLGRLRVESPLVGEFNLYNILAAISVGIDQNIPFKHIINGINKLKNIPGRFEKIDNTFNINIIIDYAHTSNALDRTLLALKNFSRGRIITVFGCGGDRDKTKRPLMGSVSVQYSDLSIITSDNPRKENPCAIIREIKEGIKKLGVKEYNHEELNRNFCEKGYTTISDRALAISLAIKLARHQDTVLIAGKGHEDYQITGSEKISFDDRQKVRNALAKKQKETSSSCLV